MSEPTSKPYAAPPRQRRAALALAVLCALLAATREAAAADLTAPTNLAGAPSSTSDMLWTWTKPTPICNPWSYVISDAVSGAWITTLAGSPAAIFAQGGLAVNAPTSVRVQALDSCDPDGSPLSDSATSYTLAAQPASLQTLFVSTGSLLLQWTRSGNPLYTRYELAMSTDDTSSSGNGQEAFATSIISIKTLADDFTADQWPITELTPGTTYHFRVRARNGRSSDAYGTSWSSYRTVSAHTLTAAPSLTAVAIFQTQVQWDWAAPKGAVKYKVWNPDDGSSIAPDPRFTRTYTGGPGAGWTANTRHGIAVAAYNTDDVLGLAATLYFYTEADAPSGLSVTAQSTNSISLSWSANGNPEGTYYDLVTAPCANFERALSTTGFTTNSAVVTDLFPASTYYFRVRAISGSQSATPFSPAGDGVRGLTTPSPSVSISSSPRSPYMPQANLVGNWHLDESVGPLAVDAVSGSSGTVLCLGTGCSSTPTFSAGRAGLGNAAWFLGVSSSLVAVTSIAGYNSGDNGALTVSAWVKPTAANQPNGTAIVAKGAYGAEDFSLDVFNGRYRFMYHDSQDRAVVSDSPLVAGSWAHVLGVYKGGADPTLKIYVNGVLSGTANVTSPRGGSANDLQIGCRRNAAGVHALCFAGGIDEVRVFNKALSDGEALAEYNESQGSLYTAAPPNDAVQIAFAPNAFGGQTRIYVSAQPLAWPVRPGDTPIQTALSLLPTAQFLLPDSIVEIVPTVDGVPFAGPLLSGATVYLPYHDANGDSIVDGFDPPIHTATLAAWVFEPSVLRWTKLPSAADPGLRKVAAVTQHFSLIGLFGSELYGSSLANVRAYPVPWKIGTGGKFDAAGLTFDHLPSNGFIRIFNIAGERVAQLAFAPVDQGRVTWNGDNYVGQPVASGVYFAFIKSHIDYSQRTVKFAIER